MRERIAIAVKNSNTLADVRNSLIDVFKEFREEGCVRIGYVSGVVTSDGLENIPRNIERLMRFTDHVRSLSDSPIFSATDVFDDALFERLEVNGFKNEDWTFFWRETLGAEQKFVTDMFMTPRWENSKGATDEHRVAKKVGMNIYYIKDEI